MRSVGSCCNLMLCVHPPRGARCEFRLQFLPKKRPVSLMLCSPARHEQCTGVAGPWPSSRPPAAPIQHLCSPPSQPLEQGSDDKRHRIKTCRQVPDTDNKAGEASLSDPHAVMSCMCAAILAKSAWLSSHPESNDQADAFSAAACMHAVHVESKRVIDVLGHGHCTDAVGGTLPCIVSWVQGGVSSREGKGERERGRVPACDGTCAHATAHTLPAQ